MRALSICLLSAAFAAVGVGALPARGDLQASADITTQTVSPNQYHYSFNLHNTGDTEIGTFWYAWDDSPLDFLPSYPDNITSPAGWYGSYSLSYSYTGGYNYLYTYGIEWYNTSGAPVAAGDSMTGFSFDTNDSPAVLAGISNVPPINPGDGPFPVGTSFVYIGLPEADPGFQFVVAPSVAVPEPAAISILGLGVAGLLLRRGRGKSQGAWRMTNQ